MEVPTGYATATKKGTMPLAQPNPARAIAASAYGRDSFCIHVCVCGRTHVRARACVRAKLESTHGYAICNWNLESVAMLLGLYADVRNHDDASL